MISRRAFLKAVALSTAWLPLSAYSFQYGMSAFWRKQSNTYWGFLPLALNASGSPLVTANDASAGVEMAMSVVFRGGI